ncbi:LysR family transcriptional regulator [Pimelobacter simplex]|uniref:LysR family transcriptional regulator n=1 Tax=Nocardioides simplex TaxID=2045 RepID=UPI003AAD996E
MLLRRLEYLAALAREEHFGRAAEACHVTQPALSAGIRKLERELGVQVVRRGQRFEGFTNEGAEVLRWAQRMLAERAALDQTIATMHAGLTGTLRIGAIPTALTVSPLLTTPVRERHPLVGIRLLSMSSREIVRGVNDFELDVGMTYVDGEPLGQVRVIPLYRERYLLLTPADGEHGAKTSVTWDDAARSPLCLLTGDMQNRRIVDGHLADTGRTAHVVVETDTVSALYAHVASMGLCSVVPHAWLPTFGVPEGLRAIPLPTPRRSHQVGLVLAGHGPESLLAQAVVETAREVDLAVLLEQGAEPS